MLVLVPVAYVICGVGGEIEGHADTPQLDASRLLETAFPKAGVANDLDSSPLGGSHEQQCSKQPLLAREWIRPSSA